TRLHEVQKSAELGVEIKGEVGVDSSKHDSVARYSRDFVKHICLGRGVFTSADTIEVGRKKLKFDKAMVATGASAAVPPIPGLKDMPHLTNSNFWNLEELPPRMGV
ncbi:unnamed protein product, partial [Ectocarpus fasciculatus]